MLSRFFTLPIATLPIALCLETWPSCYIVRFRLRLRLIRMAMLAFLPIPSFSTFREHSNNSD